MKVPSEFFGMMYQGSSVDSEGNVKSPYFPIPVGVQRLWDTRATMTFQCDGLESQCALANRNGSKVMFTFGFSADPAFPPASSMLREGSRNRPTPDFLDRMSELVLSFHRIDFAELWNEPALKQEYWDGTPEDLHAQSAWLYARIKTRQPNCVVLSPSFNDLLEPSGLDWALRYSSLMRNQPACDGIAVHMYAKSVSDIYAQLANLDRVTQGFEFLPIYCTEYNGPWEAFDIFAARGFKCLVLNGQQPPAPYSDEALSIKWKEMVTRLTTVGTTVTVPSSTRKGCNPFSRFRS